MDFKRGEERGQGEHKGRLVKMSGAGKLISRPLDGETTHTKPCIGRLNNSEPEDKVY
jgi:hypothetical protein